MTFAIKLLAARLRTWHTLLQDVVLIILTAQSIMFSTVGLDILVDREKGSPLTSEELQLIALFVGVNGIAFMVKSPNKKPQDTQL